jgi:IclR family transcriptional regulator, pca regulon regulatory protein
LSTLKAPKPIPSPSQADRNRARTRSQAGAGRDGKEFMASLAKGLAVLGAFGESRPSMSLTEAAGVAGLSRAAARRVLLTLAELGFVEQSGRDFTLAPRVLELGFGYLAIQSWIQRAEPLLKELTAEFHEQSSAATLQGTEIVFVSQIPAPSWIMSPALPIGTRLPAFHTAHGRVLLGYLDDAEIWKRLQSAKIAYHTPATITDAAALVERIKSDRAQGFSIVDEELERDVRSLAVPIVTRGGTVVGAINLVAHAARTTRNEMRDRFLPRLREAAQKISGTLV